MQHRMHSLQWHGHLEASSVCGSGSASVPFRLQSISPFFNWNGDGVRSLLCRLILSVFSESQ